MSAKMLRKIYKYKRLIPVDCILCQKIRQLKLEIQSKYDSNGKNSQLLENNFNSTASQTRKRGSTKFLTIFNLAFEIILILTSISLVLIFSLKFLIYYWEAVELEFLNKDEFKIVYSYGQKQRPDVKVGVVSMAFGQNSQLTSINNFNKKVYCKLHEYDYLFYVEGLEFWESGFFRLLALADLPWLTSIG